MVDAFLNNSTVMIAAGIVVGFAYAGGQIFNIIKNGKLDKKIDGLSDNISGKIIPHLERIDGSIERLRADMDTQKGTAAEKQDQRAELVKAQNDYAGMFSGESRKTIQAIMDRVTGFILDMHKLGFYESNGCVNHAMSMETISRELSIVQQDVLSLIVTSRLPDTQSREFQKKYAACVETFAEKTKRIIKDSENFKHKKFQRAGLRLVRDVAQAFSATLHREESK